MLKVVIDTNVLVSAFLKQYSLPGLILNLALKQKVFLCLTEEIMKEYQEVLSRDKFIRIKDKYAKEIKDLWDTFRKIGLWVNYQKSVNFINNDPSDNMFLSCAPSCFHHQRPS